VKVPFHWRDGRTTEETVMEPAPPVWQLPVRRPAEDAAFETRLNEPPATWHAVTFERRTLRNGAVEYIEKQDPSERVKP